MRWMINSVVEWKIMCKPLIIVSVNPNEVFVEARTTEAEETARACSCAWCRCGSKWMDWPWAVGDCCYHHGKILQIVGWRWSIRLMCAQMNAITAQRGRPPRQSKPEPEPIWAMSLTSPRRCIKMKSVKRQSKVTRSAKAKVREVVASSIWSNHFRYVSFHRRYS